MDQQPSVKVSPHKTLHKKLVILLEIFFNRESEKAKTVKTHKPQKFNPMNVKCIWYVQIFVGLYIRKVCKLADIRKNDSMKTLYT